MAATLMEMSATNKHYLDLEILRLKAARLCTISGIQGTHSLQVGVAYYYRGHYLYAYPAGNPIEPIPYSTKKGISIIGTVADRTPVYDAFAKNLVYEPHISALERSVFHGQEEQRKQEARLKEDVAHTLDQEDGKQHGDVRNGEYPTPSIDGHAHSQPISRAESPAALSRIWQLDLGAKSSRAVSGFVDRLVATPDEVGHTSTFNAPSMPSLTAPAPLLMNSAFAFTPHDRAQFLAYSAPGSRLVSGNNTPYTSRPVSPTHGLGPRGLLRPVASTSRLRQLVNEADVRKDLNPLQEFSEECYTHEQLDAIIKSLPHPSSQPQSRTHTPAVLRDADHTLYHRGLGPFDTSYDAPRPLDVNLTTAHESTDYNKPPSEYSTDAQPPSRNHSPASTVSYDVPNRYLYLPGLGHTENPPQRCEAISISSFASQETLNNSPPFGSQEIVFRSPLRCSPNYWAGDKPLGLARPRAASFLLNSSYNATHPPLNPSDFDAATYSTAARSASPFSSRCATDGLSPQLSARMPKCTMPFHDDDCDGVTTTNKHLTAQARESRGFKDLYPTIVCQDERVMIDWDTMMREERATAGFGVE